MMKRLAIAVLILAGTAGIQASEGGQETVLSSPKLRIEWAEFKKQYDQQQVVVVDVRDGEAYEDGHIPGARSIPLDDIPRRAPELKKLKTPIVLYCA
jgi:3-mercaptopyruvate sulfurtransferase SseA